MGYNIQKVLDILLVALVAVILWWIIIKGAVWAYRALFG